MLGGFGLALAYLKCAWLFRAVVEALVDTEAPNDGTNLSRSRNLKSIFGVG